MGRTGRRPSWLFCSAAAGPCPRAGFRAGVGEDAGAARPEPVLRIVLPSTHITSSSSSRSGTALPPAPSPAARRPSRSAGASLHEAGRSSRCALRVAPPFSWRPAAFSRRLPTHRGLHALAPRSPCSARCGARATGPPADTHPAVALIAHVGVLTIRGGRPAGIERCVAEHVPSRSYG